MQEDAWHPAKDRVPMMPNGLRPSSVEELSDEAGRSRLLCAMLICAQAMFLSGCSTYGTKLLQANVRLPSPPATLLPFDSAQRVVISGEFSAREGRMPKGGVLDDSTNAHWNLSTSSYAGGGLVALRYKLLWLGVEMSGGQQTLLGGLNGNAGRFAWLACAGVGEATYSENITYQTQVYQPGTSRIDTYVDSYAGSAGGLDAVAALAGTYRTGIWEPFVSARFQLGPNLDGTDAPGMSDAAPALNSIGLSQSILDLGTKVDIHPRVQLLMGGEERLFMDGKIHGPELRFFCGASVALWRV